MITFAALFLIGFGWFAAAVMTRMGVYDQHTGRWTDLIVVLPFYAGAALLLWLLASVCVQWLP